jgi:A/G-specific adenine glycosylase
VLLARRPPAGLWGGLWGFPECESPAHARRFCREVFGLEVTTGKPWPEIEHGFSHFRLRIAPIPARVSGSAQAVMENPPTVWYNPMKPDARGLSAPVQRLLQRLRGAS